MIADAGIDAKVPQQVWNDAVATLIGGHCQRSRRRRLIGAIERCGAVLAQHFPPGALNRNELPDKLIEYLSGSFPP